MYHFHNTCPTPLLIIHIFNFQAWVLQHLPCIFGCSYVLTYIEDMPCASAFAMLIENQVMEIFGVYLDCLVAEDMHFQAYTDHRQMCPLQYITFYSIWLTCESHLMYLHLPECVMRQFDYMQFILRYPSESAPTAMEHRDVDAIFDD